MAPLSDFQKKIAAENLVRKLELQGDLSSMKDKIGRLYSDRNFLCPRRALGGLAIKQLPLPFLIGQWFFTCELIIAEYGTSCQIRLTIDFRNYIKLIYQTSRFFKICI